MKYPNLAGRLFNQPLLVEPSYLATFVAAFGSQDPSLHIEEITVIGGNNYTTEEALANAPTREQKVAYQVMEGVAVIPVSGTLVNKGSYLPSQSGMQGYNGILGMFSEALDDPRVNAIVLDIDSSGGEVAGCFDLARLIASARDEKPVAAFVGEKACSAAYAIASAAEQVFVPDTGILGSIGVVVAHQDRSKELEEMGVKVTLIHSGAHKVDGNPFEALSKDVKDSLQASVDTTRQKFAELVAENRGMKVADVLATEARTYHGEDGVAVGLADAVMSFNEVINYMIKDKEEVMAVQAATDTEEVVSASAETPETIVEAGAFDAQALVGLCEQANATHLVAQFIQKEYSKEQVEGALAAVSALRDKLVAAEFTAEQISAVEKNFANPAELASSILEIAAKEDQDIRNAVPVKDAEAKADDEPDYYGFQN